MTLIPAPLDPLQVAVLSALSLCTSALTASLGAGGGLLMLTVMASLLPANVVIPVHGMVQLGSNVGRAWMARRAIDRSVAAGFLLGALIGAACGSQLIVRLPPAVLQIGIGLFVLWLCWLPGPRFLGASRRLLPVFAAIITFLSLFVGAIGPPVMAYLQRLSPDRVVTVATAALCMSLTHLCKLGAFSFTGFSLSDWLGFAVLLIVSGLVGTWCGLKLLRRLPERGFRLGLKLVLTGLALRLVWQALPVVFAAEGS